MRRKDAWLADLARRDKCDKAPTCSRDNDVCLTEVRFIFVNRAAKTSLYLIAEEDRSHSGEFSYLGRGCCRMPTK